MVWEKGLRSRREMMVTEVASSRVRGRRSGEVMVVRGDSTGGIFGGREDVSSGLMMEETVGGGRGMSALEVCMSQRTSRRHPSPRIVPQ